MYIQRHTSTLHNCLSRRRIGVRIISNPFAAYDPQRHAEIAGPDDRKVLLDFVKVLGSQRVLESLLLVRRQTDMLPAGMASLHQILLQNEFCVKAVKLKADFAIVCDGERDVAGYYGREGDIVLVHTPSLLRYKK